MSPKKAANVDDDTTQESSDYKAFCDVLNTQVGVPPSQWGRVGKTYAGLVKREGATAVEGAKLFCLHYKQNTWKTAQNPLTLSVFQANFEEWYYSWKVGNVVSFETVIPDAKFLDLSLPFDSAWLVQYAAWRFSSTLGWNAQLNPVRFSAFQQALASHLHPYKDRASAEKMIAGIVAIVKTSHPWLAKEGAYDNFLNQYPKLLVEYLRLNSRLFRTI